MSVFIFFLTSKSFYDGHCRCNFFNRGPTIIYIYMGVGTWGDSTTILFQRYVKLTSPYNSDPWNCDPLPLPSMTSCNIMALYYKSINQLIKGGSGVPPTQTHFCSPHPLPAPNIGDPQEWSIYSKLHLLWGSKCCNLYLEMITWPFY